MQLLRQEIADPGLQRRLRIVEEQAERMASAVRELLERARPDASGGRFGSKKFWRPSATPCGSVGRGGRQIGHPDRRPLPGVAANGAQLELALLNVVINAVDAMPQGGALTLVAAAVEQGVRIEVSDTGTGIPADVLPRIFEPWVTTKAVGRGTGLGLSIARDVITARRNHRRGHRAWRRDDVHHHSARAATTDMKTAPPARILIVDDDLETCRLIAELVAAPGSRAAPHADRRGRDDRARREPSTWSSPTSTSTGPSPDWTS